jgi:hypothetical protein
MMFGARCQNHRAALRKCGQPQKRGKIAMSRMTSVPVVGSGTAAAPLEKPAAAPRLPGVWPNCERHRS